MHASEYTHFSENASPCLLKAHERSERREGWRTKRAEAERRREEKMIEEKRGEDERKEEKRR